MRNLMISLSLLFWLLPAHASDGLLPAALATPTVAAAAAPVCPPATPTPGHLAQVTQTDCCKGHKGICGCRAGKIVCCDNTISPTCTCHSDWNEAL